MLRRAVCCFVLGIVSIGSTYARPPVQAEAPDPTQSRPAQTPAEFDATLTRHVNLKYLLYLPQGYERRRKQWPLVLYLHGAGERGSDLERLKRHGPPKMVAEGKKLPFILVSPQCPDGDIWHADTLDAFLGYMTEHYRVDPDRVYCTGLSMGGYGAWELAAEHPERLAAILPICGGGDADMLRICRMKSIPVWAFHGAKDPVVPIGVEEDLVKALRECGGSVWFTIYPDAKHDAWTRTYKNRKVFKWMLQQRRGRPATSAPSS
jgi:predicted peptidase